jgi:hypothetical protein
MSKEKLKLLVQAMNNTYWTDSEWCFVRPKSDGSYNTNRMIITAKSYGWLSEVAVICKNLELRESRYLRRNIW